LIIFIIDASLVVIVIYRCQKPKDIFTYWRCLFLGETLGRVYEYAEDLVICVTVYNVVT